MDDEQVFKEIGFSDRQSLNIGIRHPPFFSSTFNNNDNNINYKQIFCYYLLTLLWTLLLTAIPIFANLPPKNYYPNHPGWYTGNDLMRLLEPIGGVPLNFLVFHSSGIFTRDLSVENMICIYVFIFATAVYGQGAGFHSASNMFKNSLNTIWNGHDDALGNLNYYMYIVWEHEAGHYMYAAGYGLMNVCQLYAFKDHKIGLAGITRFVKVLLISCSIVGALLIGGVAAEFPSGLIVGLVYLIVYGLMIVGGYVVYLYVNDPEERVFTCRPVLHYYLLSYCLALLFVVIYIAVVGGFNNRKQAGFR